MTSRSDPDAFLICRSEVGIAVPTPILPVFNAENANPPAPT